MRFKHTNLPIEKEYPKLVRDKIPEIMKKFGKRGGKFKTAKNDKEYLSYLLKKLVEEAVEAEQAGDSRHLKEELADVLEITGNILKLRKISPGGIRKIQNEKRQRNGGFKSRIILIEE